jgi:hypothetical protein
MSTRNDSGKKAFLPAVDVKQYLSATIGSTAETASLTGAGERSDGFWDRDGAASTTNGHRDVILRNSPGTFIATVNGACSVGDNLYTAASGKLSTTPVGRAQYKALEAATADGDQIEVSALIEPAGGNAESVTAHTADYQLLSSDSGTVHTNTGAAGAINIKLPSATVGLKFTIGVGAAQSLTVQTKAASGDKVCLPDTGVPGNANKGLVNAGTLDVALVLQCLVAGIWSFVGGNAKVGIWTAEP